MKTSRKKWKNWKKSEKKVNRSGKKKFKKLQITAKISFFFNIIKSLPPPIAFFPNDWVFEQNFRDFERNIFIF